jgi:hypothetical protein
MSNITVTLTKAEFKKLKKMKKKKKKAHSKKKKREHIVNSYAHSSTSDELVRQKPIISQTNALSPAHLRQYNNPFPNNNVLMNPMTTPYNDSREHGIVKGELNNATNKIINFENEI